MGGQYIIRLRHLAFQDIVEFSRPSPLFWRNCSCRDPNVLSRPQFLSRHNFWSRPLPLFFLQYLQSCDLNFCRNIKFGRDLVCTCPKFDDQTAFHSLSICTFLASIKSFPYSNSNMYSIQFSQNLCMEKSTPFFHVALSCERLEPSWSLFFLT